MRRSAVGFGMLGLMVMSGVGCGGSGGGDGNDATYDFVNSSSVTVTVKPERGERFPAFTLGPGDEKTINNKDIEGDVLDFSFTPGSVDAQNSRGLTVFRD